MAIFPPATSAVKVAPLTYDVVLESGQSKKGYIDVTNTEPVSVTYNFSVQAFKQLNAQGDLQFYDDEHIKAGLLLDYDSFDLQPNQTLRLVFVADGAVLPSGDSFAAIFATAVPQPGAGATAVRVGTILTIQNGAPTERRAEITGVAVPFLQIGDSIKGTYAIKNTSDPARSTGFIPQVELTLNPIHKSITHQSSLVFAGIERQNDFAISTNRFGFYQVSVNFGDSRQQAWVFFATPLGLAFFGVAVSLLVLVVTIIARKRSRSRRLKTLAPPRRQ